MRLGAEEGDEAVVVEADRLPPEVAHLEHLAERLVERRVEPTSSHGRRRIGRWASPTTRRMNFAISPPSGSHSPRMWNTANRLQPVTTCRRAAPSSRRRPARTPMVADAAGPRIGDRRDGLPRLDQAREPVVGGTRPEEIAAADDHHLDAAAAAAARRCSMATRIAPFRSSGFAARPRSCRAGHRGRSCRRSRATRSSRPRPGRRDGVVDHRNDRALPLAVPGRVDAVHDHLAPAATAATSAARMASPRSIRCPASARGGALPSGCRCSARTRQPCARITRATSPPMPPVAPMHERRLLLDPLPCGLLRGVSMVVKIAVVYGQRNCLNAWRCYTEIDEQPRARLEPLPHLPRRPPRRARFQAPRDGLGTHAADHRQAHRGPRGGGVGLSSSS